MDYESRIALAAQLPFLILVAVLLATMSNSTSIWFARAVRMIEIISVLVLAIGGVLGPFGVLSRFFPIPEQTSRQVGGARILAMTLLPLIKSKFRSPR